MHSNFIFLNMRQTVLMTASTTSAYHLHFGRSNKKFQESITIIDKMLVFMFSTKIIFMSEAYCDIKKSFFIFKKFYHLLKLKYLFIRHPVYKIYFLKTFIKTGLKHWTVNILLTSVSLYLQTLFFINFCIHRY